MYYSLSNYYKIYRFFPHLALLYLVVQKQNDFEEMTHFYIAFIGMLIMNIFNVAMFVVIGQKDYQALKNMLIKQDIKNVKNE